MFDFKVKADTNIDQKEETNQKDITLKFKGLEIFSYLENHPGIYQRIQTFGIDYEFEESVKDPIQSDGYREEIERIINKLNVLDNWRNWRKYFEKFKLKLSMLQKLIDVCTFKKTTYTEQGSFVYDDESKFQVNLGNVYKCNIKSFTVSVYIKNYNDYVKDVEQTELSHIRRETAPVFIEDPDGMYIKDFEGNYVIDYQPSQHMDVTHYSIDKKETKKWRPIDVEYVPETQKDIDKREKQNQIDKATQDYENELNNLEILYIEDPDGIYIKDSEGKYIIDDQPLKNKNVPHYSVDKAEANSVINKFINDQEHKKPGDEVEHDSNYKIPENNNDINKEYYQYYSNGGESFKSNLENNKKYFEDVYKNFMKNKKK